MSAFEIERIEFLRPWQALIYMSGAINGAIFVKTRDYKEHSNLPAKGSMYSSLGLSSFSGNAFLEHPWIALCPGRYRLVIDVFTALGVQSYEHGFEVIESGVGL